jgi:hypothetical protein
LATLNLSLSHCDCSEQILGDYEKRRYTFGGSKIVGSPNAGGKTGAERRERRLRGFARNPGRELRNGGIFFYFFRPQTIEKTRFHQRNPKKRKHFSLFLFAFACE